MPVHRHIVSQIRRFSQLSPARKALVRLFQKVNFGEVQGVHVRDADPIFDQASVVVIDVKLYKEELPRPEFGITDFDLGAEVCRLISLLDELKDGTIQRLEVRAGVPRHIVFESPISAILSSENRN
jgi:hypothetical protein